MEEVREAFWAELEANTGQNRSNHVEKSREYEIVPFRVEFRTNGFASKRAGEQEGVLTTHPLIFQGSRLTVNAAAGEGRVAVEVLDEGASPLPGYGREECMLKAFDSTQQEVSWRGKSDLAGFTRSAGSAAVLRSEGGSLRVSDSLNHMSYPKARCSSGRNHRLCSGSVFVTRNSILNTRSNHAQTTSEPFI